MSGHSVVPSSTHTAVDESEALQIATERAEKAEAQLAELQNASGRTAKAAPEKARASRAARNEADVENQESPSLDDAPAGEFDGVEELRKDSMMAHLLDSLEAGKDIGHYGRLVFAMVARHFLAHEEVLRYLTLDPDFPEEQALLMLRQVEGRDYNPPKRERILEWQGEQEFPIVPNPQDPDCGNLYRNLKFPDGVYEHIGHYQEEKLQAGE
jgi:hypothetical protein